MVPDLRLAVMFSVAFCGFFRMIDRVHEVSVCDVGMVRRGLVITMLIVLCRFFMMPCCERMMFRGFQVVRGCVSWHGILRLSSLQPTNFATTLRNDR